MLLRIVAGRGGELDVNAPQLVGGGEFVQSLQPEMLEEKLRGAVEPGPAGGVGFAANLDQFALDERLHDTIDGDATNLLDFRAGDRLPVGDDGEGLQRGM